MRMSRYMGRKQAVYKNPVEWIDLYFIPSLIRYHTSEFAFFKSLRTFKYFTNGLCSINLPEKFMAAFLTYTPPGELSSCKALASVSLQRKHISLNSQSVTLAKYYFLTPYEIINQAPKKKAQKLTGKSF